jgi:hypothetical protein
MPKGLQQMRANTDSNNSHNTQYTRVKQNILYFTQKALSPAKNVLEDATHQTRPKIDQGDASWLVGNKK